MSNSKAPSHMQENFPRKDSYWVFFSRGEPFYSKVEMGFSTESLGVEYNSIDQPWGFQR